MKKMWCFLLVAVICSGLLAGCDSQPSTTSTIRNTEPVSVVGGPFDDLSAFLDNEQFVPGLSQTAFVNQLEKYRYEGKTVTELVPGYYYDGIHGGGYRGSGGKTVNYRNDYEETEDALHVNYSNYFQTQVALEGLTLPYGIVFTDTITEVFEKMDLAIDPYSDFVADEGSDTRMTLFRDNKTTLMLLDMGREKSPAEYLVRYILVYTECYTVQRADGRTATVTRNLELAFSMEDGALYWVSMYVNEYYKR